MANSAGNETAVIAARATGAPTEGITKAFTRDAAERRAQSGPEWLRDLRLRAWKVYEETPLPTTKLEEWRYTEVEKLRIEDVELAEPVERDVPEGAKALLDPEKKASGRVLQVGARVAHVELDEELRSKGVILMDLAEAAREHSDLVREHLATRAVTPEFGKFAALSGALWTAGVFLYVPKGVRVEHPIRVGRWIDEEGKAFFPRTLIVAEEGAHVAYVDEFRSPDFERPTLSMGAVEVFAAQSAHVQYVALQRYGRGVHHVSMQKTLAERDSDLDTLVANIGASVARLDLAASLNGPSARSDMLGVYFGQDDQHFDHNTRQDHVAPHATSDLLYKGALEDRARGVFRGIIRVHPKAQLTDAYQTNRNLLLSPEARSDSLPNLEIEADDVRCSHGATIGNLDQEELFYLMSRGLPRRIAERLVVFGFLGEVLDRLPLPEVVEELRDAIEEKLDAHHAGL